MGMRFLVGKIAKKSSLECIFDNMALYFECQINQTVFWRFCPLGLLLTYVSINNFITD